MRDGKDTTRELRRYRELPFVEAGKNRLVDVLAGLHSLDHSAEIPGGFWLEGDDFERRPVLVGDDDFFPARLNPFEIPAGPQQEISFTNLQHALSPLL